MSLPVDALPAPLGALLTGALVFAALLVVRRIATLLVTRIASRTGTAFDDRLAEAIGGTNPLVLAVLAASFAADLWLPDTRVARWTARAAVPALLFQVGAWGSVLVRGFTDHRRQVAMEAGQAADATAWTALSFLARLALWSVLALVALDNLGVDVTALVAGLGIGGLAIGLAVQNVLADLFASLAIVLDRPFSIGDFLVVGDVAGTVEHVGLKTTRVRALSGEVVVVSNTDLLTSRIRNFRQMQERRVVLSFGVLYDTPPDVLERIPALVRDAIEAEDGTRFDRAHLHRLGESSMDYEAVYILESPDYNRHMDVQQAVLLSLVRAFAARGIGFAYPTRTLYLHDARADAIADREARAGA